MSSLINSKRDLESWQDYYWNFIQSTTKQSSNESLWSWSALSRNLNISMDTIINNDSLHWDWTAMSYNPNLTKDILVKYNDKKWNYKAISNNTCITLDIITLKDIDTWDWDLTRVYGYG